VDYDQDTGGRQSSRRVASPAERWRDSAGQFGQQGGRGTAHRSGGSSGDSGPAEGGGIKEGDWVCVECKTHNFASRRQCFGCGIQRSEGDPNFSACNTKAKTGEWICEECGLNNFFYRTECYRCYIMRPVDETAPSGSYGSQSEFRAGDWMCPQCNAHNFSRKQTCFKCDTSKPANIEAPRPAKTFRTFDDFRGSRGDDKRGSRGESKPNRDEVEMRPGDWFCPECDAHNFASKRACFRCNVDKPAGAGRQGGARGSERLGPKEADWNCPECGFSNFATRSYCKRCETSRTGQLPSADRWFST